MTRVYDGLESMRAVFFAELSTLERTKEHGSDALIVTVIVSRWPATALVNDQFGLDKCPSGLGFARCNKSGHQ